MEAALVWKAQLPPDVKKEPVACCGVVFSPCGEHVLCIANERILVFDRRAGTVINSLRGHKAPVYCLCYAANGKWLASGGADKAVIIWSSTYEGIVKYSHNESVQCVAFNPETHQLVSGATTEFGVWHVDQSVVSKTAVTSKVLCLAWSKDGNHLAMGHLNAHISIRDKNTTEKVNSFLSSSVLEPRAQYSIQKNAPISTAIWIDTRASSTPRLMVTTWSGTCALHTASGETLHERMLDFIPCALVPSSSPGELDGCIADSCFVLGGDAGYFLVGGTDGVVHLMGSEDVSTVGVMQSEGWCWGLASYSEEGTVYIATSTTTGAVTVHGLKLALVFSIFGDWYVSRDMLDSILLQNLETNQSTRLSYNRIVDKLAIYERTLAVQVAEDVYLYSLKKECQYELIGRITRSESFALCAVTSYHVHFIKDHCFYSFDFDGALFHVWSFSSHISCISAIGGPTKRESFLIGLEDGEVSRLYLHNSTPQLLVEHPASIRSLDFSRHFKTVAIIDAHHNLSIYDAFTQAKLHEETSRNIESVMINRCFADMFAFTSLGTLNIKTADLPCIRQRIDGRLISLRASVAYLIQEEGGHLVAVDIVQSPHLQRFLRKGDFNNAYRIACMSASAEEWKHLGVESAKHGDLELAKKCFSRVHDVKYLDLVDHIEKLHEIDNSDEDVALPELLCFQGNFEGAAEYYAKLDQMEKALGVFSRLKMFEEGHDWLQRYSDHQLSPSCQLNSAFEGLLADQVKWSEATNDLKETFYLYLKSGRYEEALQLAESQEWSDMASELTKYLSQDQATLLERCANLCIKFGQHEEAEGILMRLTDNTSLIEFYCSTSQWSKLQGLVRPGSEHWELFQVSHADWLMNNDDLDEAVKAFASCGAFSRAISHLHQKIQVHLHLEDFSYVSALYVKLAQIVLVSEKSSESEKFHQSLKLSDLYYTYNMILYPSLGEIPQGIRLTHVLYVLFKTARIVGAQKLAKNVGEWLLRLHLRKEWRDEIQIENLRMIAMAAHSLEELHDAENILPRCYRCGSISTSFSLETDTCKNCHTPFHRCFVTFDQLPLVEFYVEDSLSSPDALLEIRQAAEDTTAKTLQYNQVSKTSTAPEVLNLEDSEEESIGNPFHSIEFHHLGSELILDKQSLREIPPQDIEISTFNGVEVDVHCGEKQPNYVRYFKKMDEHLLLHTDRYGHLYLKDEYDLAIHDFAKLPFMQ